MSERAFPNPKDLENKFIEYVKWCKKEERLPNVAGFSVYADINRDTFYQYAHIHADTFKKVNAMLEDEALNNKFTNDTLKIFYMKNKCGYRDNIEVQNEGLNKVNELLSKIEEGTKND